MLTLIYHSRGCLPDDIHKSAQFAGRCTQSDHCNHACSSICTVHSSLATPHIQRTSLLRMSHERCSPRRTLTSTRALVQPPRAVLLCGTYDWLYFSPMPFCTASLEAMRSIHFSTCGKGSISSLVKPVRSQPFTQGHVCRYWSAFVTETSGTKRVWDNMYLYVCYAVLPLALARKVVTRAVRVLAR
jgi:hypothetical protein